MARRLSYAELMLKADQAKAREKELIAKRKAAPPTYTPRPPRQTAYYKSYLNLGVIYEVLLNKQSANILVLDATTEENLTVTQALTLGLKLSLNPAAGGSAAESAVKPEKGASPAKFHWFEGSSTPTVSFTDWGTKVVSFAAKTGGANGQKNRSIPIGDVSGEPSFGGIKAVLTALLSPVKKGKVFANRGQGYLAPELGNVNVPRA